MSFIIVLRLYALSVFKKKMLLTILVTLKMTFFKVTNTENINRVIGFPQNQIFLVL